MTKQLAITDHVRSGARRDARPSRDAVQRQNPQTQMLLGLQRTAGNAAVAGWLAAAPVPVQRKKKKAKPKPKPTLQVSIDDKGRVRSTDAGAMLIGFKDAAGTTYVRDPKDKNTSTFYEADGTATALTKLRQVDVTPATADAAAMVTFGSSSIDAALAEEGGGMVVDSGGTPVVPASMPASLQGKMVNDVRLELADGVFWVLMTLPDGLQWVRATHSKSDWNEAEKDVKDEAANLPASKKKDFEKVSRFVAMVRMMEAHFGDKSGAKDPMASVGIFQWGMKKKQSADTGSLGKFLKKLETRATEASAKKPDKRTDEDNLYINAWKQCTDAGLGVTGEGNSVKITLNGDEAKGEDVEDALAGEMDTGALRTYQLIAAMDWIDDMKATIVMPGEKGEKYVGNGYSKYNDKQATLVGPKRTLTVSIPDAYLTIGAACGDNEEAMAVMADVLPNRPAFVQTALWRAMSQDDVNTQVTALLGKIEAAEPGPAAPAAGKKKKPKPPPALTGTTVVDKADYEKIQGLLWPSAAGDDDTLVDKFEQYALELYKADKTSKFKSRAARMASVHIVDWQ